MKQDGIISKATEVAIDRFTAIAANKVQELLSKKGAEFYGYLQTQIFGIDKCTEISELLSDHMKLAAELDKRQKESREKAIEAQRYAEIARNKEVGFFTGKQEAIEAIQRVLPQFAETQIATIEALTTSFAYTQILSKIIMKVYSIALSGKKQTNDAIHQIKEYMQTGEFKSLDDNSKSEFKKLCMDLKSNQSIYSQIDDLKNDMVEMKKNIKVLSNQANVNLQSNSNQESGERNIYNKLVKFLKGKK